MADIDFSELLKKFRDGVRLEAEASDIDVPASAHLEEYLTDIYWDRHERRNPDEIILDCAQILGQVACVMYRSELPPTAGNPHIPHNPIAPVRPPTRLEKRHVDLAREMYAFYMNSNVRRKLANPLVAPIPEQARRREIDQPCPLCP